MVAVNPRILVLGLMLICGGCESYAYVELNLPLPTAVLPAPVEVAVEKVQLGITKAVVQTHESLFCGGDTIYREGGASVQRRPHSPIMSFRTESEIVCVPDP